MNKKLIILIGLCLLLVVGCGKKEEQTSDEIQPGKVSCAQMAKLMSQEDKPVLIDVRTKEEYEETHLAEAINIPVDEIVDTVAMMKEIDPVNTKIIVYCKSGARSNTAYEKLKAAGYKQLYDLGAMSNCG